MLKLLKLLPLFADLSKLEETFIVMEVVSCLKHVVRYVALSFTTEVLKFPCLQYTKEFISVSKEIIVIEPKPNE